jgi:hypothetical protein
MSKLRTLLICPALAVAGLVFAGPVTPGSFAEESATRPMGLAMTELQNQNAAQHQELDNKNTATFGDGQPASAANPAVSGGETKDKQNKKKEKGRAKPDPSDQEEQFNRVLLGIYG